MKTDEAFALVERAAVAGVRCPQADDFPEGLSSAFYKLPDDGRIKIETYAHNWRVVEILTGPNAGKRTAPCPYRHKGPWRITDKSGTHYPRQDASRGGA